MLPSTLIEGFYWNLLTGNEKQGFCSDSENDDCELVESIENDNVVLFRKEEL